ncbi:MAG: YceI family protein [Gallionella sp.]|nr:YceI family protein [Gallionella sp.]
MRHLLILPLLFLSTLSHAAEFTALRAQQSRISFVSEQMGVPVEGEFKKFTARIALDTGKPQLGTARIDIDLASIDVGSDEAYEEVNGKSWFDSKKHPTASFVSDKVTCTAPGRCEVSGKMTIRNVTREVKAPFTFKPQGGTLLVEGAFPLKRLDYGIGSGLWGDTDIVANEVQIRFRLTLSK